ncbi:peptidase S24/S26A/S26B/S26C, partial [Infundibulicybe gibba]
PNNQRRLLIKRIIGIEGDMVKTLPPYPEPVVHVPKGHVWVEGDEPHHSDDSNRFGPVPLGLAESRLMLLVWPPHRIGPLPKPSSHLFERVIPANVGIRGVMESGIVNP